MNVYFRPKYLINRFDLLTMSYQNANKIFTVKRYNETNAIRHTIGSTLSNFIEELILLCLALMIGNETCG